MAQQFQESHPHGILPTQKGKTCYHVVKPSGVIEEHMSGLGIHCSSPTELVMLLCICHLSVECSIGGNN